MIKHFFFKISLHRIFIFLSIFNFRGVKMKIFSNYILFDPKKGLPEAADVSRPVSAG